MFVLDKGSYDKCRSRQTCLSSNVFPITLCKYVPIVRQSVIKFYLPNIRYSLFTVVDHVIREWLVPRKNCCVKYRFEGNLNSKYYFLECFTSFYPRQSMFWLKIRWYSNGRKFGASRKNIHAQSLTRSTMLGIVSTDLCNLQSISN